MRMTGRARGSRTVPFVAGFAGALFASAAIADVHVAVSASPDPVRPGETVDLEITVSNDGPFDRTDVQVVLDYPAGLAYLDDTQYDGDCPSHGCEPGEQATLTIASLPAGNGVIFSLPPRVLADATDRTTIAFDVDVFDDAVLEASGTASVTVDAGRELELALVEVRDPVPPGGMLTYSLTFGVHETSGGAASAMLSLPVPPGTSFVSATDGGALNGAVVQWSLGNLNPGSIGERRATFQVNAGAVIGSLIIAEATFDDQFGNIVQYRTATRVLDEIPLELMLTATPDPIRPGETIDLELTVGNSGPFDRTGVVVELEYPDHAAYLDDTLYNGDCPSHGCEPTERSTFTIGTLPAGEGRTFSLPAQLEPATENGVVTTFEAVISDSTGDSRETGASIAVKENRILELAMIENRDPVTTTGSDSLVTYTLTFGVIEKSGGSIGSTLRFLLPPDTSFISASDGGVSSAGEVVWSLGALNPGASGERRVTLQVDGDAVLGSILSGEAVLENTSGDLVAARTATRVQAQIPLQLRVSASPDPAIAGEILDVELTVSNAGPFDRTGVVLELEIPDSMSYLDDTLYAGDCPSHGCEPRERSTFTIGTLPAGRGRTFFLPVQIIPGEQDGIVLSFEAEVSDGTGDRRESGANIAVRDARTLDLALFESDDPVTAGSVVTYTLTYGTFETGNGAPEGTLRLRFPPGAAFVSASDGGVFVGDAVEWNVGNLNPGAGGERFATLQVDGALANGSILHLAAELRDQSGPINETRFQEATRIQTAPPIDVGLAIRPNPVAPGGNLKSVLSVVNTTGLDRTGVILTLEYPGGLAYLDDSLHLGDCPSHGCEPLETAIYTVGTLPAGQQLCFVVPPQVLADTVAGTVINFDAHVTDSTGFRGDAADAVMVGSEFDPPGDAKFVVGDLTGDGQVGPADLANLLASWGACPVEAGNCPLECPADLNVDNDVGPGDLAELLANWT